MSDVSKLNFNGDMNQFTDEIARGLIGNVEDLQTEAKDSLVNALNEVDDKSSGLNDELDGVKRRLTSAEENLVHVTSEIGEMNQLKTTDKNTMVGAINEIFDRSDESVIGDLDDLNTTNKNTLVGAINETYAAGNNAQDDIDALETAVGDLADLYTTDKSSIVNAINEVAGSHSDSRIGNLSDLTTTEKSTVVGAINEVNTNAENAQNDVDALETTVGDLVDLDTSDKTSVVGAINEANTKAENAQDDVDALETAVGDLADLDTTDKSSIVNAINEIANTDYESLGFAGGSGTRAQKLNTLFTVLDTIKPEDFCKTLLIEKYNDVTHPLLNPITIFYPNVMDTSSVHKYTYICVGSVEYFTNYGSTENLECDLRSGQSKYQSIKFSNDNTISYVDYSTDADSNVEFEILIKR